VANTFVRILTAIQLTRLTLAFGAVSDLWFIILYSRMNQTAYPDLPAVTLPLALALLCGAVVAVGLFAYTASLNDILDVRHDSAFSPQRPIPAGRIRASQATVVAIAALIISVLGSAGFSGTGQVWAVCLTLLTAAGLLFYNAAGRFIPPVGIVTVGLIHAVHMFIPNHQLTFVLPVWLIMTHAMVIAALVHVLEDKRPMLTMRGFVGSAFGWLTWSAVLIWAGSHGARSLWPGAFHISALAYPLLAIVGFICVAYWKVHGSTTRIAGAEKLKRYGAMWQSLYGSAWMLAVGYVQAAIWLGLFALAGFVCMTLIREMHGATGRPMAYRG
jgi:4-hydroxybenzoate polyprenyltransferase